MTPLKEILVNANVLPMPAGVKFDKSQIGSSDFIRITPFRQSNFRYAIYILLCIGSCGLLFVFCTWWPQLFTYIARKHSRSKKTADFLLIESDKNVYAEQYEEVLVHRSTNHENSVSDVSFEIVWFEHKKARYVYNNNAKEYERVHAALHESLMEVSKRMDYGYGMDRVDVMKSIFGENAIPIIPTRADKIFVRKIFHPFYLFQTFSCIAWICIGYTEYAILIFILSGATIYHEVSSQLNNMKRLRDLGVVDTHVNVYNYM